MGLFDIFRRHKKNEDQENKESNSTASVEEKSAASEEVKVAPAELAESTSSEPSAPESDEVLVSSSAEEAEETGEPSNSDEASKVVESVTEDAVSEAELEESAFSEETAEEEKAEDSDEGGATPSEIDATETIEESEPVEESASEVNEAVSTEKEEDDSSKKYDEGLEKSRTGFGARLNKFLANFRHVDEDFFEDLEDMLIESDVGYDMAMKLSDSLREEVKLQNAKSKQDVSNVIIEKMVDLYEKAGEGENSELNLAKEGPTVIMFVGVNGAGKTTTIGKMAALFKKQGKKVLLAAADTFRAGATEQLDVWAKRDGVDIVTGPENGDPAAVVFDAVQKAKKEDYDILFVDTAGRLQNKVNLMKELAKMKRILTREIPDAPHEVLLVLDATTGQNALNQAKLFKESTDVTGIVLTKLDGTARGGIVLAIRNELHLPVKYVGLGEKVTDLQKFDASEFVYGLFKGLVEVD
ncbi:signal recognition particle-docking protein FtsY [Lactobacillaceae bacterium 24-114]